MSSICIGAAQAALEESMKEMTREQWVAWMEEGLRKIEQWRRESEEK